MATLPTIREDQAIQRLHHITIVASDAARTVDFYTRVLGLRLVEQNSQFRRSGELSPLFRR